MAQQKKVKWALGTDEPDDLADFKDNEQIVKENKGLPPKGTYTFAIRRVAVKPNKNGDDRISVMLIMKEEKKGKGAPWNGYLVWDGFNVTEQGAPYIKRWLKALGLTWKDFINASKRDDQDPPHIVQIGRVKFEQGSNDPTVRALVKIMPADEYNEDEHLEIARYLPADDAAEGEADEPAEEEATTLGEEAEGEDEETLTVDRLNSMDLDELHEVATQAGIKPKKFKGMKKKALRELIIAETNLPPF
jgi:hypothetical protein